MCIDKTWQQNLPGKINNGIGRGRELFVRSDFFDDAVLRIEPGIFQFTPPAVHGDKYFCISGQECGHCFERMVGDSYHAMIYEGALFVSGPRIGDATGKGAQD